jgi:hypothetical protein
LVCPQDGHGERLVCDATNDIWLVRGDGSDAHRIDGPHTVGYGPLQWSPDSTMVLAYVGMNADSLDAISIDGSEPPIVIPAAGSRQPATASSGFGAGSVGREATACRRRGAAQRSIFAKD